MAEQTGDDVGLATGQLRRLRFWRVVASRAWHLYRFPVVPIVLISLVVGIAACGGGNEAANGILTVVRVEERMPDGSMVPVSGARVEFEMYGSRADDSIRRPLYHEFEDTTDANGLSVVFTDPLNRAPTDIGLLLVDVIHPDGRSGFKRAQVDAKFDFAEWSGSEWSEGLEPEALIDSVCETAIDFPDCDSALGGGNLVTWGLGLVIRLKPSG